MKDQINFHAKFATENFLETTDYPIIYPWFMKEKIGKKHALMQFHEIFVTYKNLNKLN